MIHINENECYENNENNVTMQNTPIMTISVSIKMIYISNILSFIFQMYFILHVIYGVKLILFNLSYLKHYALILNKNRNIIFVNYIMKIMRNKAKL